MTCLFCKKNEESLTRYVQLGEGKYSHDFPINDIVDNLIELFTNLFLCKNCKSVWKIESSGKGDPRSTYPEFYEQRAIRLNSTLSELVLNPTVARIISNEDLDLPRSFASEALESIKEKEEFVLKELYLSRKESLPTSVKFWLENWFEENFADEFFKFKEVGYHTGSKELFSIEAKEEILATEFVSLDDLLIWIGRENEKDTRIISRNITTGIINWEAKVTPPFIQGMNIPILFYQSGYICSLHGVQIGSKHFDKLNRPDKLEIRDLQGSLILSTTLEWKCYEVLSTEERDYSESRIVCNFQFSIISDVLYLPFKNEIIIYDLSKKEEIRKIKLPSGQFFLGQISVSETNQFFVKCIKGYVIYDSDWNLELNYLDQYHPVFIDFQLNIYYYYAIVLNKIRKTEIVFSEEKESGVSLVKVLSSPPVLIPTGIFLPFSDETSYFLNSDLTIKTEVPFSTLDVLGPHSYGDTTVPYLVTDDNLSIFDHFRSFVIMDFEGNVLFEKKLDFMVKKLLTFDGKHIALLEEVNDGYGIGNNFEATIFDPNGKIISSHRLRSISGWSISFEGFMVFSNRGKFFSIDVFKQI